MVHLEIERLEERDVPSNSPFLLDTSNRLLAATDATGTSYFNTGGFGIDLSVGEINAAGGGGQFAAIRDANNRVYLFNGNSNIFTDTGAFAVDIVAGRGEVFLRDGNNRVYTITLNGINADGSFNVTSRATAAFAIQMDVGYDTATLRDFLAYRAGDNGVHYIESFGGTPAYGFSGAYAIDIAAGNQRETFIRDGANQVYALTISVAGPGGIGSQPAIATSVFARELSVGRTSNSNDMLAYLGLDSSVNFITYTPGTPPTLGFVFIPGAQALQIEAGNNEIFTRAFSNQIVYFTINAAANAATPVPTAASAIDIRVTTFSSVATTIDQLAILDVNRRLLISVNDSSGATIAGFFATGIAVNDVQGFPRFP